MAPEPLCLACGVFARELAALGRERPLPFDLETLPASLHLSPEALADALFPRARAARAQGRPVLMLYGECHPAIDAVADEAEASRTAARNCCELVLGPARYRALEQAGTYFLMPEWAADWRRIFAEQLGLDRPALARALMGDLFTRIVYLDTGCVPVPASELSAIAEFTGLPVSVEAVGLEGLERGLAQALRRLEKGGSHGG